MYIQLPTYIIYEKLYVSSPKKREPVDDGAILAQQFNAEQFIGGEPGRFTLQYNVFEGAVVILPRNTTPLGLDRDRSPLLSATFDRVGVQRRSAI